MAKPYVRYEFHTSGWHCNAQTKAFATKAGKFLSDFMEHLRKTISSDARLHRLGSGAWEAGYLVCRRGFYGEFSPRLFATPKAILDLHRANSCDPPSTALEEACDLLADYAAIVEHREQREEGRTGGPRITSAERARRR
jgi:hypothetical protein